MLSSKVKMINVPFPAEIVTCTSSKRDSLYGSRGFKIAVKQLTLISKMSSTE